MTGHSSLLPTPLPPVLGRKLCPHPGDLPVTWTLIRHLALRLHPVTFPGSSPHLPGWVAGQRGWLSQHLSPGEAPWSCTHTPWVASGSWMFLFSLCVLCQRQGLCFIL